MMHEGPEIGKSWREVGNLQQSEREAAGAIKSGGGGRGWVVGSDWKEEDGWSESPFRPRREDGPGRPAFGPGSGNAAASAAAKLHYL